MTLDAFLDLMFGRAPTATSTGPETDTHVETAVDRGTDTDVDHGSSGHEAGPEPGPPAGLCVYTLFGSADLGGAVGRMIDRIADGLGDEAPWPTARQASGIWIGSRGVVTPLHHDAWPGLLFQTHGSKRVTMFSPSDRTNLYFSPPTKVGSRWSRLPGRSADADPEEFPRIRRVARHEGELRAGDTLYIPPFWSHEIEALDANISIPFRFRVIPGDHLNPGYLRPAYEVFHGKYVRPLGHRSRRVRDAVGRARADTH